jgi:lysophospholipase L1-like esterase
MRKDRFFWIKAGRFFLLFFLFFSCSSPPENYIILCAGDSITEIGYPRFLERTLKKESIRAKVLNWGKSGNTSREYLAFLEKNKHKTAQYFPDFICLQLGTNDVRQDHDHTPADEFYANMKEIIRLFRDFRTRSGKTPQIFLATIPPIPSGAPFPFAPESSKQVEQTINPLIQKIAEEENCTLVDNFSVFCRSPQWLPDVHPSEEGYEALAQNWYAALKKEGIKAPSGKD